MKYKKNIVLITLFAMNLVDQPAPEVEIDQGILSGRISSDGSFFEYVGIPYATTNSSTRFKAPLPPPSWQGIFKAIDDSDRCPQPSFFGISGSEDCLKIHVYVPAIAKRPLPVMVYIHGGAFILGSGGKLLYAPDFLVKQDVILVTFNYRLGALGFICLGIKEAPGNAGLKDQVAALKWVQRNIAAFGGDPDNVTVFGQSAGGTSASILLASEATDGLFKRMIIQSGSSLSSWAVNRDPVWVASLLAKELGFETNDPEEMFEIFSKISYKELVAAKPKKPLGVYLDTEMLHLPCIEKRIPGEMSVLNDLPFNLLKRNKKNVPVMYGTTSKEGLFLIVSDTEETLEKRDKKYLFASDLEFKTEKEALSVNEKARELYFGNERMSLKTIMNISDLNTQLYFEIPVMLESEVLLNITESPVYNYYFNYSGGRNFLKYLVGFKNEIGACHGDELLYLFNSKIWPFPIDTKDQRMIEWMSKMWTNFAKNGNPTPRFDDAVPVKWIPSKKDNLNFLYIDNELKMGPIPNRDAYRLWKDIYDKYRKTDALKFV